MKKTAPLKHTYNVTVKIVKTSAL